MQPAEESETASDTDSSDSYIDVEEANSANFSPASPVVAKACFPLSGGYRNRRTYRGFILGV